MSRRNSVPACIVTALALTALCLLPAVANAGAPLKGVDVKLGRNPGGGAAARATTDEKGNFSFPPVPRGEYTLTVEPPNHVPDREGKGVSDFCYITLNLPGGRTVERWYDLVQNKAFDPAIDPTKQSAARATAGVPFIVVSDGETRISGTVVKSKSNMANN